MNRILMIASGSKSSKIFIQSGEIAEPDAFSHSFNWALNL